MNLVDIVNVNEETIELFSKVLIESASLLDSIGQSMWRLVCCYNENYIEVLNFRHLFNHFVFTNEGDKIRNKQLKIYQRFCGY